MASAALALGAPPPTAATTAMPLLQQLGARWGACIYAAFAIDASRLDNHEHIALTSPLRKTPTLKKHSSFVCFGARRRR
jgi:hypothetical protein